MSFAVGSSYDQMPQEPFSTEFYTRQDNEFREFAYCLDLSGHDGQ